MNNKKENRSGYLKPYVFLLFLIALFSCVEVEKYENTPKDNFEALWKIIDERYCFFEYKNVNWNEVYDAYSKKVSNDMNEETLFYLMNEMLQELKDGHVNLYSSFDVGRYWKWFEDYPRNFDPGLKDQYLGTDYMISSGIRYKVLNDSIGYMYYGDFSTSLSESSLDHIISRFSGCKGMIIDVRDNGGGLLVNSDKLASRFVNEKTLVGFIQHKTGKGHNDFSEPFAKYVVPSPRLRYQKPVVVLTNRKCYSATNDFVNSMRYFPAVTILGDKTGGGGGLPFSYEIPNGWSVRLSSCPNLDAGKEQVEFGIDPAIKVDLLDEDVKKGRDTLIEEARKRIVSNGDK